MHFFSISFFTVFEQKAKVRQLRLVDEQVVETIDFCYIKYLYPFISVIAVTVEHFRDTALNCSDSPVFLYSYIQYSADIVFACGLVYIALVGRTRSVVWA